MNAWPDSLTIAPLLTWPREFTKDRRRAPFSAPWSSTLDLLDRELWAINARNGVLQVAIEPNGFRLDGRPRATAKQTHPGIILTFDSDRGSLQFPCDAFERWQDNLRAVALAMEALRKVDRYGVTYRNEQYTGWKALNAGPSAVGSTSAAAEHLRTFAPAGTDLRACYVHARRKTHPDHNDGDRTAWDRVERAAAVLGLR